MRILTTHVAALILAGTTALMPSTAGAQHHDSAPPAAPAPAPPPLQDPLLDGLVGTWVLSGIIAGQRTTHDVEAAWVLGHQYVRLQEVSREKNDAGQPLYEAIVLIGWDPLKRQYQCLWLDSTGGGGLTAQAIGHAARDGDRIPFVFVGGDGSRFHNTFAYDKAARTWQWTMDGEEGGTRVPFARVLLTKAP